MLDSSARVPGTDGEKMSKSYGNTLEVFEEPKALRKQIMRIVTDSRPMEQPKEPGTDHLFQLYSLFANDQQREAMAAMYRRGGFGYGEVKKALADLAVDYLPKRGSVAVSSRRTPNGCANPRRRRRSSPGEGRPSSPSHPAGLRRETDSIFGRARLLPSRRSGSCRLCFSITKSVPAKVLC